MPIRQHQLLLSACASLLAGLPPQPGLQREAQSLRDAYRNADDPSRRIGNGWHASGR